MLDGMSIEPLYGMWSTTSILENSGRGNVSFWSSGRSDFSSASVLSGLVFAGSFSGSGFCSSKMSPNIHRTVSDLSLMTLVGISVELLYGILKASLMPPIVAFPCSKRFDRNARRSFWIASGTCDSFPNRRVWTSASTWTGGGPRVRSSPDLSRAMDCISSLTAGLRFSNTSKNAERSSLTDSGIVLLELKGIPMIFFLTSSLSAPPFLRT